MGEAPFGVAEMESVAFAVAPEGAVGADAGLHPAVVAILLVAVFPDIHEIVGVDVALRVVAADAGAGADTAVKQNRGDADAGLAVEEIVAHLPLVTVGALAIAAAMPA